MKARATAIVFVVAAMSRISWAEDPVYFADPNLKAAVAQALGIAEPTPTDMLALTSLHAHDKGIGDLAGLEHATNLNILDLEYNHIEDISFFGTFTSLRQLYLSANQISDISPLSGLTGLEWLGVYHNPIGDISQLSALTRLKSLSIQSCQISDLSPLSGLTTLLWLYLGSNQISDLSPLSGLTELESLWLSHNQISDLSPLSGLTRLKMLYVSHNNIGDFSALSGLTSLNRLRLSNNPGIDLSTISNLTDLQYLYLGHLQISDISPLSGLANLLELNLGNNQISDLSPLSGLINVRELWLGSNQISDVAPLSGLATLQRLEFGYNQVSDLSPLTGLINLEVLYLWANPLNPDAYDIYIPLLESYATTVEYYAIAWHTLIASSTAGGLVSAPGDWNSDWVRFSVVRIKAVPAVGYSFITWTGSAVDAGKVADPAATDTTVTIMADYTLQANFAPIEPPLRVDNSAADDPGPDDPLISDPDEDGTPEHPYDTIQEAINAADHGGVVLVHPGIYRDEIYFLGKAITVQGVATADGIPVLENPGGFSVSFSYGEGPDSVLKNFVIRNSAMAIFVAGSTPTIGNITFADNGYSVGAYNAAEPDISNCIFSGNTYGNLYQCHARYSCIEDPGDGNINAEPLFADLSHGDYHLLSEHGRHSPDLNTWVFDEVTSPCVAGGDPTAGLGDEPTPNGGVTNMGAYGGTAYASKGE